MEFIDVKTMRGLVKLPQGGEQASTGNDPNRPGLAYIRFSPRGFSEFAVIHLRTAAGKEITILINPFTGEAQIIREYKDFEWTYGKKKGSQDDETNREALIKVNPHSQSNCRQSRTAGFTLIEVCLALLVLGGSMIVLLGLQSSIIGRTIRDSKKQRAMLLSRQILSAIETSNTPLVEQSTDGTFKDVLDSVLSLLWGDDQKR